MSEVIEVVTMNELLDLIASERNLVLDFAAPSWCVPCRRLAPHYEMVAKKMPHVKFVHIDIDKAEPEISDSWSIKSVPTVIMFSGQVQKTIDSRTAPTIMREIQEHIDANTD